MGLRWEVLRTVFRGPEIATIMATLEEVSLDLGERFRFRELMNRLRLAPNGRKLGRSSRYWKRTPLFGRNGRPHIGFPVILPPPLPGGRIFRMVTGRWRSRAEMPQSARAAENRQVDWD